ncbi:hypothetical protein RJ639_035722 [Escallonia herrerae]|uniref:Reverse transcriptase RNase H-like domain-containing protein n=1 Tax=Escallonia herrerae TaxID=1293975 RepID=A0AA89BDE5_9ASTE|nr:hypothetical protein RJ639_035722 [Escallonia herrerae]
MDGEKGYCFKNGKKEMCASQFFTIMSHSRVGTRACPGRLLTFFRSGTPINLSHLITLNMIRSASHPGLTIPYGLLLTRIFFTFDIPLPCEYIEVTRQNVLDCSTLCRKGLLDGRSHFLPESDMDDVMDDDDDDGGDDDAPNTRGDAGDGIDRDPPPLIILSTHEAGTSSDPFTSGYEVILARLDMMQQQMHADFSRMDLAHGQLSRRLSRMEDHCGIQFSRRTSFIHHLHHRVEKGDSGVTIDWLGASFGYACGATSNVATSFQHTMLSKRMDSEEVRTIDSNRGTKEGEDTMVRKTEFEVVQEVTAEATQGFVLRHNKGLMIQGMFKSDQDASGILKQFSIHLDALEVNLKATDNARYAENIEWEGSCEVVNTPAGGAEHSSSPQVPEPKSYRGARDAKELENFLFDIEQYFRAIRVDSEATKVSMATMYLVGDAKLWWRKKYAEIEDGSCVINTWDILKRELKSQFFPENIALNARKAFLECKHNGSVQEYCQVFSALMLDISDMSAVDRIFFFIEGLKPWAHTELNRRWVNNLNEAIIATESLSNYNSKPQRPPQRGNLSRSNGGKKPGVKCQTKVGAVKAVGRQTLPPNRRVELGSKPSLTLAPVQCGEQSGSQSRHSPTEEQTDAQDYEEEDTVRAFPQWCNAVTTQVGNPKKSLTREKPKDMLPKKKGDVPGKGLMYVDIKVDGKAIRAMVDTRATHNYISSTEVERLGLTLEKGCGQVKAINSAAQPVVGIARSVLIKIGAYEGRTNFSVVIMDDFKLILGLDFLRDTKTTVMPCTNSLAMLRNASDFTLGGVLMQECHPVAYESRKLNEAERRYTTNEKELLASWRHYLLGFSFIVRTDNTAVSHFLSQSKITSKQAKWQELLAEFNFMHEYRAGSTNSVADALSRSAELDQVALMAMNAIVRTDSRVAINIGKKIKKGLTRDPVAQQC